MITGESSPSDVVSSANWTARLESTHLQYGLVNPRS